MRNTRMKQFDENLVNYINQELQAGLDISAVVLSLDKCLSSAKLAEYEAIKAEQEVAQFEAMQEQRKEMDKAIMEEVPEASEIKEEGKIDTLVSECEACCGECSCDTEK